jgi:lambda family phage minor tail protein L
MTAPQEITSEIVKLAPSAIIELFELDTTVLGGDVFYFHAGTNGLSQNITWNEQEYQRFPIKAEGFDISTNGQLPRPKLTASNILGTITSLLLAYNDLIGSKLTRRKTFKKYLDAVNFPGGTNPDEDPLAEFDPDIFYVDRKISESRDYVEFELVSSLDVQGIKIPRRQVIGNICPFQYRGSECGYAGSNYFTADDSPTGSEALDVCGKRLASCKKRFGENSSLPFGGFPSSGAIR